MAIHKNCYISGTGSATPSKVVTNFDLLEKAPTSDEWVRENLGIIERRIADENEFTSDLATRAAFAALENSGLSASDVELIIVATATPDRKAPSTACIVQKKLGCKNACPAFDISAVCSGFLYAMTIGAQFIESRQYKTVLVIGADTFSKITDWTRRDCVFFGDGAGAAVLRYTNNENALFSSALYADGEGMDNFTVYPWDETFTMNGSAVYQTGTVVLPKAIRALLEENNLSINDVSCLIPHQPSVRVLRKTAELLELPQEKLKMNMDRYANTAGATIPLLLDEVHRRDEIKNDDIVLFAAVGSGWTWGAAVCRWLKNS